MKFSIKNFFSKCNQIRSFLRIWSHLLKKCLMENFIFCAVKYKDRTQTKLNVMFNVKILPQQLIERSQKKISRKKCWESFLDFQQRNLSEFKKVNAFQTKNTSNEYFFSTKSKRIFHDIPLTYK